MCQEYLHPIPKIIHAVPASSYLWFISLQSPLPLSFIETSLALGQLQSYYTHSTSEAVKDMGKKSQKYI